MAYRAPAAVWPSLPETLRGQDLVTLLAALVLVRSAVRARAGSLGGYIVWLAVLLYVHYPYLLYVVAPYNDALLLYIAAIGLGTDGLLNGSFRLRGEVIAGAFVEVPRPGVAWFLLVVAALFSLLWVVDILAAIVLVKTLTLGLALLSMNAFIVSSGGEIDPCEPVIWSVMVLVTAGLLAAGARRMPPVSADWLRPSLW